MDYAQFSDGIQTLVERSPLFGSADLETVLVINQRAGGFSRKRRHAHALVDVASACADSSAMPKREGYTGFRTFVTEYPRHAGRFAITLLEEAAVKLNTQWLVVLACGDGTSLEFLDELSRAPTEIRDRFTVLRLPMGTGNDASDGRTLADSLERLVGKGRIDTQASLLVRPNPAGPAAKRALGTKHDEHSGSHWRSFNIASVGLDAYVTDMTNRLKASMPGDSYKLWLDIASILYDKVYPTSHMRIVVRNVSGEQIAVHEGRFLLVAMGVSGYRTYGANKPILPDADNVCAVRQMPLLRKLALKGPISSGKHRSFPEALLFSADSLELHYSGKLLVQMDGEAELLLPEDFPLIIERTPPLIRFLARTGPNFIKA